MNTNDPGREPEPTDAELLRDQVGARSRRMMLHMDAIDNREPLGQEYTDALAAETQAQCASDTRGMEYLSGARPMPESGVSRAEMLKAATDTLLKAEAERMPDTPAPEEAAQLRAEVAELRLRQEGNALELGTRVNAELQDTILAANTALTARVADLERENAALGAEVARLDGSTCSAQEQAGDGPCGNCPRCVLENIMAGLGHQIETLNKRVAYLADALLPATGKEPTDV